MLRDAPSGMLRGTPPVSLAKLPTARPWACGSKWTRGPAGPKAVRLRTFFAASNAFAARCQQLARVLLPRVKRFLFFVQGKLHIVNNIVRFVEMCGRIFNFRIFLRLHIDHWGLLTVLGKVTEQLCVTSWRTLKFLRLRPMAESNLYKTAHYITGTQ